MCGFIGFTGSVENPQVVLNTMTEKIAHRGPDSFGSYTDENVTFGFVRLAIVDLESAPQPIYNEDKSIMVVLNGEIYNYLDLRKELEKKGHTFYTKTDTEVLVHLYEEYEKDMLQHLRGMFAFVIYDKNKNKLFGARDHFGMKPFYYSMINNNIVFGSEIKSIIEYPGYDKKINESALENYLTFQYSVLNETFFKGIFRLYPSHCFTFENGTLDITRYYEPVFDETPMSIEEATEAIDNIMQESIKKHKLADVEVGSFLSSGVDSSYVAACFEGNKVFTVGFDYGDYNEITYAKSLADRLEIDHYDKIITTEEYWNAFSKVQYFMDEPLADPSAVNLFFLSELASKHVKVCMSGEGADELFGGYNIYREPMDIAFLTRLPKFIRKFLGFVGRMLPKNLKGKNLLIRASQDIEERFIGNAKIFTKEERENILLSPTRNYNPKDLTAPYYKRVKEKDDVTKMQFIDLHFWLLGDILLKADKMSMANSLEVRMPILDIEVFKVAAKLPSHLKVSKDGTKLAFREAAHKYLPEQIAQKKKLGFPTPIRIWLKEDKYYSIVKNEFTGEVASKYFKTNDIVNLLDRHKEGIEDNSRKIWTIYTFLVWHKEYF